AATRIRASATRRVIHGATAPNTAKLSVGSMVTTPATEPDQPNAVLTSSSNAPRLVTAARRLSPTSTTPTMSTRPVRRSAAGRRGRVGPAHRPADAGRRRGRGGIGQPRHQLIMGPRRGGPAAGYGYAHPEVRAGPGTRSELRGRHHHGHVVGRVGRECEVHQ